MTKLVAVDPGGASGVAEGHYSDTEPLEFDNIYTIPEGVNGFSEVYWNGFDRPEQMYGDELVVETFVNRSNEFLANLESVEVIGFIKGTTHNWREPHWQQRTDKAALTGAGESASEVRNNNFLKRHGLWQTGKMVGWKDGRDANDAIIHALVYMKKIRHMPTLLKYFS